MYPCIQIRLFHLPFNARIKLPAGSSLLHHHERLRCRLVHLQVLRGHRIHACPDFVFPLLRHLPRIPKAFHQLGVRGLPLLIQFIKLFPNLHHSWEVRPVLGAQLRLLFFKAAALRPDLPQQRSLQVAVPFSRPLSCFRHRLRVAIARCVECRFAHDAVNRRGH